MVKCNNCGREGEKEDFVDDGACSGLCRKSLNDAYDNYVDPLGVSRERELDPFG